MARKRVKMRIRPFRVMAVLLGVCVFCVMTQVSTKAASLDRQKQQQQNLQQLYLQTQSENNQLKQELTQVNTADFIERTARREYGYCWYGETIYKVVNIDELEEEAPFDTYDGEPTNSD